MKNLIPVILFLLFCTSCEKEVEPAASIEFKTGEGYTFQDMNFARESMLTVGIIATKSENDFKSYNVSVSYDGASTTNSVYNYKISPAENTHYEKDVIISTRNQPGVERYYFTIVDTDGNLIQKMLTFTVE